MNYGELKTLLTSYLHRTDLADQVPTFIAMAQARINRDVMIQDFTSLATVSITSGDRFVALPDDCKSLINVQITTSSGRKALLPLSSVQMDTLYKDVYSGQPCNYAVYGKQIELQPTPETDYTLEVLYNYRPTLFSADADTNDLLDRCPNIYVYAAMVEAEPFRHGEERSQMWESYYQAEVDKLNEEAEDLRFSGGPLQIYNLGVDTP